MFGCTEKIRRVANPICVVNKNIRHIVARRAPNARDEHERAGRVEEAVDSHATDVTS